LRAGPWDAWDRHRGITQWHLKGGLALHLNWSNSPQQADSSHRFDQDTKQDHRQRAAASLQARHGTREKSCCVRLPVGVPSWVRALMIVLYGQGAGAQTWLQGDA
jgi:hypothetical protein